MNRSRRYWLQRLGLGLSLFVGSLIFAAPLYAQTSSFGAEQMLAEHDREVANERMQRRALWAVLTVLAGLVGFVRHRMTKKRLDSEALEAAFKAAQARLDQEGYDPAEQRCPACGVMSSLDADWCKGCATRLSPRNCEACDTENDVDARFCIECAAELS